MKTLGKYELEDEPLGSGGFGSVYRAKDTVLRVDRAIKILHPALATDTGFVERFRLEARVAARLEHPYIVPVYDLDQKEDLVFLVMKLMPGNSLKDRLADEGRLSFAEATRILGQIAEALDFAYNQPEKVVHRDIKPGNVLFELDGTARLTDFGFAKALANTVSLSTSISGSGVVIGTPAYIAPEIWNSEKASAATDVYSLACVMHEMLTGQMLFTGNSPASVMTQHLINGPAFPESWPPDTPEEIWAVMRKALARDPQKRYERAGDFAAAVRNLKQAQEAMERYRLSAEGTGFARQTKERPVGLPSPASLAQGEPPTQPAAVPQAVVVPLAQGKSKFLWGILVVALLVIGVILSAGIGWVIGRVGPAFPVVTDVAQLGTPRPSFTRSASSVNAQPGDTQERPADGMVMVYIPAGEFEMGAGEGDPDAYSDERPRHLVTLDGFWIDRTEVTDAMFRLFAAATGYHYDFAADNSLNDHPMVRVSWKDAISYCIWVGGSLPSEAQWEKAARGGLQKMTYPWGNEAPLCDLGAANGANYSKCFNGALPVGSFRANGYGLYDMAGNVWEWTLDWYGETYYESSPSANPTGPFTGEYRVARGGSWGYEARHLRASSRSGFLSLSRYDYVGFRCVGGN